MPEVKDKRELELYSRDLSWVSCVNSHLKAEATAIKRGYWHWYWDKRSSRIYGIVKPGNTAKDRE